MRIVGGQFRGRPLAAPERRPHTRPTSDRVREALFNILAHGIADFDARGRARARPVRRHRRARARGAVARRRLLPVRRGGRRRRARLIRRNIEALGLTGVTKIFRRDATDLGPAGSNGGFALVFLDPPYGQGLAERALASAAEGGWLAPGAIAVIEERKGTTVALPAGFPALDQRAWGDTQVAVCALRRRPSGVGGDAQA